MDKVPKTPVILTPICVIQATESNAELAAVIKVLIFEKQLVE
jgi:hypothetical protein